MRSTWILLVGMLSTLGCGEPVLSEPPINWGVVDPALPPAQQAQQDALIRLFKSLQSGVAIRHLKNYEPDLEFQEPSERFFGEGVQLMRWDWAGPPEKNRLRVHLEFLLDEAPGDKTISSDRVYEVNRAGSRFLVRRAG